MDLCHKNFGQLWLDTHTQWFHFHHTAGYFTFAMFMTPCVSGCKAGYVRLIRYYWGMDYLISAHHSVLCTAFQDGWWWLMIEKILDGPLLCLIWMVLYSYAQHSLYRGVERPTHCQRQQSGSEAHFWITDLPTSRWLWVEEGNDLLVTFSRIEWIPWHTHCSWLSLPGTVRRRMESRFLPIHCSSPTRCPPAQGKNRAADGEMAFIFSSCLVQICNPSHKLTHIYSTIKIEINAKAIIMNISHCDSLATL